MLAGLLGHNIDVHREFYRLHENTLHLAKCGKMMLLMDQGRLNTFAGKSLDEKNIDLDGKYFLLNTFTSPYLWFSSKVFCEVGSLIFYKGLSHTCEGLH